MKFFSHLSLETIRPGHRDANKMHVLEKPGSLKGVFVRPLTEQFKSELMKNQQSKERLVNINCTP